MEGSIRKRGEKSWELTIELGRDAGGKRRRKFVNVKGTKAQAQQKLRELLSAYDKGIPLNTEKATLSQWMAKWLAEYVVPKRRQTTKERYERAIKRHILPELGHIQLVQLTPRDIQALETKMSADGMAPAGVQVVHNVLSGALKYALKMEMIWRNPAQAVTPPKVTRTEVEPPDIAGVRRVLELARTEEHPLFPCLYLIAYTGIRRGEALGLRWQDVDLEGGSISIVQTLSLSVEHGLIFQPPKTNSGRRVIDLDDGTVEVMRSHQGWQLLYRAKLEGAYQENGLLFPGPLGEPRRPLTLGRAFQSFAKRLGLKGGKLHDLRHFHASVMLQNGASLLLVSKSLGHANISTTGDVYGHIMPGWQKEAANAFAKAMEEG